MKYLSWVKSGIDKESESKLWKEALFVFDASALLNLYRFQHQAIKNAFSNCIEKLRDRIRIPCQTKHEFFRHRLEMSEKNEAEYNEFKNLAKKAKDAVGQIQQKSKNQAVHPVLSMKIFNGINRSLKAFEKSLDIEIQRGLKSFSEVMKVDPIEKLVENCNGGEKTLFFDAMQLGSEAGLRASHQIPPGYIDYSAKDKIGIQKWGDLIFWKEILKISSEEKKNIILVMDDLKDDWWVFSKRLGKKLPREELLREFNDNSSKTFWMYTLVQFFDGSKSHLGFDIGLDAINELRFRAKGIRAKEIVENNIDLIAEQLINYDDNLASRMAETNACMYELNWHDISLARYRRSGAEIEFHAQMEFSGEQMEDKMYCGDSVMIEVRGVLENLGNEVWDLLEYETSHGEVGI